MKLTPLEIAQVQSQPAVWQGVQRAQKSLPRDVAKSIETMFSGADRKKWFFESTTYAGVPARKVFESTVTTVPKKVVTLPPSSQEGADSDNGSSGAKRKCVPLVASASSSSQVCCGASQVPGADVERYKLSYSDWGKYDDEIDWDALTNGDID